MNLETYIRSSIVNDSILFSHVSNKVFQNVVPQNTVFPAIVFFVVSETPKYCQGGKSHEDRTFQFSILSDNKDNIAIIKNRIDFLFDNKGSINLTNETISLIEKRGLVDDEFENETRVHHVAISYNFKIIY